MITQGFLKSHFLYYPDTGIFKRLKPTRGRSGRTGSTVGTIDSRGYNRITIQGRKYSAHRLAWLYTHGVWPSEIDHIDRNPSNNVLTNLREVTSSVNCHNRGLASDNTSGTKGVTWHKNNKCWEVRLMLEGKRQCLGCFKDKDEAIKIRKDAECNMI